MATTGMIGAFLGSKDLIMMCTSSFVACMCVRNVRTTRGTPGYPLDGVDEAEPWVALDALDLPW